MNVKNSTFDFQTPVGYQWLLDRNLVGMEAGSALQPWHYFDNKTAFDVTTRWPSGPSKQRLVAFAKRQDCDDLACFQVGERGIEAIVLVHGRTPGGYEIIATYGNFWEWLKSVVEDIAKWVEHDVDT